MTEVGGWFVLINDVVTTVFNGRKIFQLLLFAINVDVSRRIFFFFVLKESCWLVNRAGSQSKMSNLGKQSQIEIEVEILIELIHVDWLVEIMLSLANVTIQ